MAIMDPTLAAPDVGQPDVYALTDDNKAEILALIRDKMAQWGKGGREAIVRNAWRNLLFLRSHQWLVYDRGRGWWRPISVEQYDGPRPVTNTFASTMGAFASLIARIEPTPMNRPATDEPEDRATGEVADRVIEVCEAETNVRLQRQLLAAWCAYTGGAWMESGYDPSAAHGTRLQQDDRCLACGAQGPPQETPECAACGGPTEPAVDAQGAPEGTQVPIGKQYTEVCTLFEMFFDPAYTDWTTVPEYIRKKASDKAALSERWGAQVVEGLSADSGLSVGESYQDQLPALAGYQPETGPGAGLLQQRVAAPNRISETYYWAMPTEKYPEGVLAVVLAGSTVVYLGPLPYRDDRGPFLPTVYFPISIVPGTLYSKTPADDVALKQVQRNQHEAMMMMTMNRMGWPIWLIPEGANIAHFTGYPGQLLTYSAIGTNGAKPERVQGAGLPNGAILWLEKMDREMEELCATFAGTKGDHQPGVSAGISLQMIEDRKNQRHAPMYVLWEQGWAEWCRQQLAIFRQFATEPRLLKIQGRGSQWRVRKFLGADLTGTIDVAVEAGSGAPRSTLVERAETEQLFATGTLNPRDPETQLKVLESYGRSSWLPGMKADAETAAKQIEQFEQLAQDPMAVQVLAGLLAEAAQMMQQSIALVQAGAPGMQPLPPVTYDQLVGPAAQQGVPLPRVRPDVDGHSVLARELGAWLKGDASQQLPEPIQRVAELKHTMHVQLAQQQAMQQIAMQGGLSLTSGFLNNPGGQQGPTSGGGGEQPPSRMQGEQREMEANAG